MSLTRETAKAATLVIIITVVSKVLGFTREMAIGAVYGATSVTDAYLVAIVVPAILFVSVFEALKTSFIPLFTELFTNKGEKKAYQFTNNLINILLFISIILILIGIIFAPQIIRVIAIGFDESTYDLTVKLTRLAFPMICFVGLAYIFTGILQAQREFVIPALIGIPYNFSILFFLLFLSGTFDVKGLVVATVVGSLFQVLIQFPFAKQKGYSYYFLFDLKDNTIIRLGKLVVPVILGMAVQQVNVLVDRMLASGLVEGSISALNFANRLNGFVYGVFTYTIATIMFPLFSKFIAENNIQKFKEAIIMSTNVIFIIIMPITAGSIVLREPIVRVLFERGQFDSRATLMTASALLFYSIGMFAFGLRDLYNRVFYSLQDTKTPMINGIYAVVINIVLNIILVRFMAHSGLAFATSISAIVTTVLLIININKRIEGINFVPVVNTFLKTTFASGVMGILVAVLNNFLTLRFGTTRFLFDFANLSVCISAGFIVYLALIYILKIPELDFIIKNMPGQRILERAGLIRKQG
jgi:putative peptidoglycan lipid II flippase